jgi:hypothetical protein
MNFLVLNFLELFLIKFGNKLDRKFEQSDKSGLINLISLFKNVFSLTNE